MYTRWDSEYKDEKGLPTSRPRKGASRQAVAFATALGAPSRILDIGCGLGSHVRTFEELGHQPVGIDISLTALVSAQTHTTAPLAAVNIAHHLPFRDDAFDAAYDGATIINLSQREQAKAYLSEVHRVLRPRGIFQIFTPVLPDGYYTRLAIAQRSRVVEGPTGIVQRVYSPTEFLDLLSSTFEITSVTRVRNQNEMYGQRYERYGIMAVCRSRKT